MLPPWKVKGTLNAVLTYTWPQTGDKPEDISALGWYSYNQPVQGPEGLSYDLVPNPKLKPTENFYTPPFDTKSWSFSAATLYPPDPLLGEDYLPVLNFTTPEITPAPEIDPAAAF